MYFFLSFIFSLATVGLSHGLASPYFGVVAACLGYACFWRAMLKRFESPKKRYWISVAWFFFVQAIQLSWFTSIKYMGPLIIAVYLGLIFFIALQFGLLSFLFNRRKITLRVVFSLAGSWTLFEWLRTFYFSGFTWNPAGLALAGFSSSIQFSSLFGVYGLSFWVIFVNAFALYAWGKWKRGVLWLVLAAFPYMYGTWQEYSMTPSGDKLQAALVQTALLPEQKDWLPEFEESYLPPLNQWERIWYLLDDERQVDLIVLPEAAVGFRAYSYIYPVEVLKAYWEERFGKGSFVDFPPLEEPFAKRDKNGVMKVTNIFIAKGIASRFGAGVITGFDHREAGKNYNAAFHIPAGEGPVEVYEKRVLVPVAEYIPFPKFTLLTEFLAEQFGIGDSFSAGAGPKIFHATLPIGISICVEETYNHMSREARLMGAKLFVNVTNDLWFPKTHLPKQHLLHGQLRSAENGMPALRACNSGVTAGVDCFGKVVEALPMSEEVPSTLYVTLPLHAFSTLYTWWGNLPVLMLSMMCAVLGLKRKRELVMEV